MQTSRGKISDSRFQCPTFQKLLNGQRGRAISGLPCNWAIRNLAMGRLAIGHLAIGHSAIGTLAIGHLAIRTLAIGHSAIGILAINVNRQSSTINPAIFHYVSQ